ncbi:MAG: septal ring lytic transglycosylase RlpA family protein [Xanthobacteraceae bacterium]
MIFRRITSDARTIASGLLMLCGALTEGKAQVTVDQDAQPPLVEAAASDPAKKDTKTGDLVVRQRGVASWYGRAWRGRRTASGRPFDDRAMTAAHLWLPLETMAHVTNVETGRSVEVVVNDRGPYHGGRIIDLSAKAAEALGIKECGTAEVVISAQY